MWYHRIIRQTVETTSFFERLSYYKRCLKLTKVAEPISDFAFLSAPKSGKSRSKKILKITEDHLLFVEKEGEATAIPARYVTVGDTVFVRGDLGALERDAVQNISHVHEKGVYAPVTLSGTILVNDVLTSCYIDVLSHESSNKAMSVARAVYHISPWMLQWLSSVG